MKRKFQNFFFLLLLGTIGVNAQPVITDTGFTPVIGDKYILQVAKPIYTVPSFNGVNKVWDFSTLVDSSKVGTISFVSPKGLFYADSFPNSNIAALYSADTNVIEYDRADKSGWGQIAYINKDTTHGSKGNISWFSPQYPYMIYPMTLGTIYTDSVQNNHSTIKPSPYRNPYINYDTLIGVGYGTLKLPNGIMYYNVLCVNIVNGYLFVANGYHFPLLAMLSNSYNNVTSWNSRYISGKVLPLEITDFTVSWQNESPYLQWNATNTLNTKAFNIQRSIDGHIFGTIGQVAVNSSSFYHFEDSYTLTNNVYYRLQQVDKDGQIYYSKVVSLTTNNLSQITIAPNPANEFATIKFGKTVDKAAFAVYDITGKVVISESLIGSTNAYKLNTQILTTGVYVIKVNTATGSYNEKLLINK